MSIKTYRETHPSCEANCGRVATDIHHIRTRGAGGDDDDSNLLALCWEDHRRIHSLGVKTFGNLHPCLHDKLKSARARMKPPLAVGHKSPTLPSGCGRTGAPADGRAAGI